MSREDLPSWLDSPAEVAGILVTLGGLSMSLLVVGARVWRDQHVSLVGLGFLTLAGALIYAGHHFRKMRASKGSIEVDFHTDEDPQ